MLPRTARLNGARACVNSSASAIAGEVGGTATSPADYRRSPSRCHPRRRDYTHTADGKRYEAVKAVNLAVDDDGLDEVDERLRLISERGPVATVEAPPEVVVVIVVDEAAGLAQVFARVASELSEPPRAHGPHLADPLRRHWHRPSTPSGVAWTSTCVVERMRPDTGRGRSGIRKMRDGAYPRGNGEPTAPAVATTQERVNPTTVAAWESSVLRFWANRMQTFTTPVRSHRCGTDNRAWSLR